MKQIQNLIVIIVFFIAVTACNNNKQTQPQPDPEMGTLHLHLHTNVDTSEVSYGKIDTMTGGRKISVDSAQLYISHIELIKLDGSVYSVPDTVILQVQDNEVYPVAKVPAGNYKSIRFYVGLDATTNQKVPSSSYVLNKPSMWFGASAEWGYVFINFQGKIDTTQAANGSAGQMEPFVYRIGTSASYKQVTMPDKNYTVTPNQTQFIHLTTDYSKLLNGVQLNNSSNLSVKTVSDNATTVATTISSNIPSIFSYEE